MREGENFKVAVPARNVEIVSRISTRGSRLSVVEFGAAEISRFHRATIWVGKDHDLVMHTDYTVIFATVWSNDGARPSAYA